MEDGGIGREDTFSLSLENEILLGRKPLEKQLTHSSACDNPTVVMLLGSQRAWTSCQPHRSSHISHPERSFGSSWKTPLFLSPFSAFSFRFLMEAKGKCIWAASLGKLVLAEFYSPQYFFSF